MRVVHSLVGSIAGPHVSDVELLCTTPLAAASLSLSDTRVPTAVLHQIIERALDLTDDPALGLHCVERLSSDAFNPISGLVLHAASWQQAMTAVLDFSGLFVDEVGFCIEDRRGKLVVSNDGLKHKSLRVTRFVAELIYSALFAAVHRYRAEQYIKTISFEYAAPEYATEYERVFKGLARFDQSATGMQVDRELMRAAGPHPDAELCSVLRGFAKQRLLKSSHSRSY